MDQELYLEKLRAVADCTFEDLLKADSERTPKDCEDLPKPQKLIVKLKDRPCDYFPEHKNCRFKINKKPYNNNHVLIQKCLVCEAIITPKGRVIPKEDQTHYNYPLMIYQRDRED